MSSIYGVHRKLEALPETLGDYRARSSVAERVVVQRRVEDGLTNILHQLLHFAHDVLDVRDVDTLAANFFDLGR